MSGKPQLALSLAGCTQLRATHKLEASSLASLILDGADLPALEHLSVKYDCNSVSMAHASLLALRSLQLECNSASLDPALVPRLQSLTLGWGYTSDMLLSLKSSRAFTALRCLCISRGSASMPALLQELLQRAPQLVELTVRLPSNNEVATAQVSPLPSF